MTMLRIRGEDGLRRLASSHVCRHRGPTPVGNHLRGIACPLHVLAFIGRTHIFPRVARFCSRHRMTSTDTTGEAG